MVKTFEKNTDLFCLWAFALGQSFQLQDYVLLLKSQSSANHLHLYPFAWWIQLCCCNGSSSGRKLCLSIF